MRRRAGALALGALLAGLAPGTAGATPPDDAARCLAANAPRRALRLEIELRSRHRGGAEFGHRGRLLWRRGADGASDSLLCMTHPPGVRGLAYLIHERAGETEVWGYLPEEERVLRIQARGAARRARIGKTAIGYDDFQYLPVNLGGALAAPAEAAERDGRPVWRLRLEPAPGDGAPYARIDAELDRESCVPLRTAFYDESGEVVKRVRADPASIAAADGLQVARSLRVHDLAHEVETELRVTRIDVDPDLPEARFTPRDLARGRCR